ncbi:MAG: hypothetical protein RSA29_11265 [Clostridium sp.]|uniref:hypothetical protein n=1 Tax=Clostridium sp. TaxID=1506 RepID=UPI00303DC90D
MSRELRELRRIRQSLNKNKSVNTNSRIDNLGNKFIKIILLGWVVTILVMAIILAMIMY